MAKTKAKYVIKAKDCMPFYKNGKDSLDYAILKTDGDKKSIEADALKKFVDSIVPVDIFKDKSLMDDVDSKLAYSPFESTPFPFRIADDIFEKHRVWQAGRYIGSAQIDETIIEIEPRFGTEWLEYILNDVTHFKLVESGSEQNRTPINDLMRRILWHLWVRKFAAADQYGLPKRVVKRTQVGMHIRGHLNVRKSLFSLFTKREVVSEYREKDIDDTICRIVYKAYCILVNRKFNKTQVPSQIQDSLNSLYSYYQGQPISVNSHDFYGLSYKSIYLSWKPLVDFSWQIIQKDSLFKQKGAKDESLSIFLDMAEIWEAFLRKKLGEAFANDGWRALSVDECKYRIYEKQFYSRPIIPDIILEKDGQYMVFDAKYKRMRANKEAKSYDVDRTDLFQIHTYIHYVEHHLGHVVIGGLLYPLTKKAQAEDGDEIEIIIDENKFHSEHLYGWEERNNANDTKFIIDGVYCPEYDKVEDNNPDTVKDEMIKNVEAMIKRIKSAANL